MSAPNWMALVSDLPFELTPPESRIQEEYVWLLDQVGRCAQGMDEGNWHYLSEKAGYLSRAAAEVARLAAQIVKTTPRPRANYILAAVKWYGRLHRAGRLLHPMKLKLDLNEVGNIVLAVAGSPALALDDARMTALQNAAERVARRTDVDPATCVRVLASLITYEVRDDGE